MKKRFISVILSAVIFSQLFVSLGIGAVAEEASSWTPPLSIADSLPEGDLIKSGDFTTESLTDWSYGMQHITHVVDENGGYLKMSDLTRASTGFNFYPSSTIGPGTYKFTGYFRTANPGEISMLQLRFVHTDGTSTGGYNRMFINNNWLKTDFYITLETELNYINVRGGPYEELLQEYYVDHFSMVPIDPSEIPDGYISVYGNTLGLSYPDYAKAALASMPISEKIYNYDPVKEAEYEVGGIIINHDGTDFFRRISNNNWTEKDIIDYALQFEGTHVTDYVMCVYSEGTTMYPSRLFNDYVERYHTKEQLGQAVDYTGDPTLKGAHLVYDVYDTDYIGLWHDTFREIGINPWISFRMNDVHELMASVTANKANWMISDFYYKNPQLRRVKHHKFNSYQDCSLNYKYEETREFVLSAINDALNRYDTYGVELDYQREVYVFGMGDEYIGLDIMNDFIRSVDDLVKIYEEKYGHEIKISARVPSDIQTCADFGLDVITWAAEGIIDLYIPTGRHTTTDTDIPVKVWTSVMNPYGVEIAPCIEQNMLVSRSENVVQRTSHYFSTMTALAANGFSQGASKVAMYNYFRQATSFANDEKITLNSDLFPISSNQGSWNLLTTIGSYDKLMTVDRRLILTFNDITALWKTSNAQLPKTALPGEYAIIHIPIGDIPKGATLTLKISTDDENMPDTNLPPTVYVNSELCTYVGTEHCKGSYTADKLLCYEIPAEAYNSIYMLAEISTDIAFTIEYAEVYLKVAD